jgi:hypothetical protein
MVAQPTQADLLALWKKNEERKATDKVSTKKRASAIKRLISAHEAEYKKYLAEA